MSDAQHGAAPGVVEAVLSRQPFRLLRTVRWNECDPAGIVHAGRYGDYVYSVADLFLDQVWDGDARAAKRAYGVRTPVRRLTIDFERSLNPGDRMVLGAAITSCGHSALTLAVEGFAPNGARAFAAEVLFVCVDLNGGRAIAWPPWLRTAIETAASSTSAPTP